MRSLRLWFAKNYSGGRFLTRCNIIAPSAFSSSNRFLKRMTSLFQDNFKIQVHVYTDSEIPNSLGFLSPASVPFHLCFWISFYFLSFFFMLLTHLNELLLISRLSLLVANQWSLNSHFQDSFFSRLDIVSLGCPEVMSKTKFIPYCLMQFKAVS